VESSTGLGAVVRAPAAGVVSYAGTVPTSGKCVTIETADGWSVTLTHLGSVAVTTGASVVEGDGVGTLRPGVSLAFMPLEGLVVTRRAQTARLGGPV
jgi:septal ring factor EnvC (AmiA/AmiB activator)